MGNETMRVKFKIHVKVDGEDFQVIEIPDFDGRFSFALVTEPEGKEDAESYALATGLFKVEEGVYILETLNHERKLGEAIVTHPDKTAEIAAKMEATAKKLAAQAKQEAEDAMLSRVVKTDTTVH
jgi:hypothetical protein